MIFQRFLQIQARARFEEEMIHLRLRKSLIYQEGEYTLHLQHHRQAWKALLICQNEEFDKEASLGTKPCNHDDMGGSGSGKLKLYENSYRTIGISGIPGNITKNDLVTFLSNQFKAKFASSRLPELQNVVVEECIICYDDNSNMRYAENGRRSKSFPSRPSNGKICAAAVVDIAAERNFGNAKLSAPLQV